MESIACPCCRRPADRPDGQRDELRPKLRHKSGLPPPDSAVLPLHASAFHPPKRASWASFAKHTMARLSFAGLLTLLGLIVVRSLAQTKPFTPRKINELPDSEVHLKLQVSADATQALDDAFAALSVLQNDYFDANNGTWPTAIEWTSAVVGTVVSGMLSTMTQAISEEHWKQKENLIASVFAQVSHSFFGQEAEDIKTQAYDDILWVVLGWLETIKFVRLHAQLHYPGTEQACNHIPEEIRTALRRTSWQGYNYLCTFSDRSREFWDLATNGWDETLCHGGMIWNPRLLPYKNAITNELWIAASAAMYEFFPNDTFSEEWVQSKGFPGQDPIYLAAAIEGYKWLGDVNMTNDEGLYVDGYHVDRSKPGNVECDERNEMVYTYNQGVILTGHRGLWSITGSPSYLDDGHSLIRSVIKATGWDLMRNAPVDIIDRLPPGEIPPWRGLGRGGILEEQCDVSATCSQDGQTFKGIFFHHLTAFCAPITAPGDVTTIASSPAAHDETCRMYLPWVKHNVDAARKTRDGAGKFGMWWGAGIFNNPTGRDIDNGQNATSKRVDYRNKGIPMDGSWGNSTAKWEPGAKPVHQSSGSQTRPDDPRLHTKRERSFGRSRVVRRASRRATSDPNDRGRGRTVETQMGGLALLRAYFELSQRT
ncbi:glycosyl hydrolase [Purpureocillium lilacinum]|uniref:Glycosyl hydrolase n=1 Tax=Purpureocillium lilacinum TaxID=33203 RepID=A0A2U3EEC1_PURLI|nr:glycosyl hydrolase [Purpureocillium lilacinum]